MVNHINKNSPIPYYVQLKEQLKLQIEQNILKSGDQVPTEQDLCETFGVSRTVVRQALQEMTNEGLIKKIKGKGTFVAERKINEGLVQKLTGFYQDMVEQGYTPVTKVLSQKITTADNKVASNLKVELGSEVIEIERLRFIRDEPIVLVTTYLPKHLCPGLLFVDLSNQSLYAFLEKEYGLMIVRGHRTIMTEPAQLYEAKLLGIKKGSPLFVLESTSYLDDGTPIEYYHAFHRGDRSRFVAELVRSHNFKQNLNAILESPDLPPGNLVINRT